MSAHSPTPVHAALQRACPCASPPRAPAHQHPPPSAPLCSLLFSPHPLVAASCCCLLPQGPLLFCPQGSSHWQCSLSPAWPLGHPSLFLLPIPAPSRAALSPSLTCTSCPAVSHLSVQTCSVTTLCLTSAQPKPSPTPWSPSWHQCPPMRPWPDPVTFHPALLLPHSSPPP